MFVTGVSTIILTSVIFFAIIVMIATRAKKQHNNGASKTLPGPPRWPLFGNTFYFTHKVEDMYDWFTSIFDSYPSIYQVRIGPSMIVAINDPDLSKTVLIDHKLISRAYVRMIFNESLGKGLITAEPATWRLHRKIIGPTLNSTFLRHFIDVFDTQSRIMVKQLKVHQDGPKFDMEHYISNCIIDIIVETVMNVKLGTQLNQDQVQLKRALDSVTEISSMRFFKPWLYPDFFFNLSSLGVRHAKYVETGRGFARRVIEKQMKEIADQRLSPNVVDHGEHADTPPVQRRTLLNLLMAWEKAGVKMQKEEIIDELITVVAAALDTTATAMNMLMLALACYPDVQEKVYEEVMEVCGNGEDDGQTTTVNQLNNLVYLERVIKETLRLFPIIGFIPRDVMEDMTIGDYYVPKGAVINVAIYAIHRNKKIWPDPLKFDPDRFLPEEVDKRHPYAYMPFGAGSRNCIGGKFAMMTIKIMCAKVVQKYALEKDHPKNIADTKMKIGITSKPCDPVEIRIRKRKGNIANASKKSQSQESAHRT